MRSCNHREEVTLYSSLWCIQTTLQTQKMTETEIYQLGFDRGVEFAEITDLTGINPDDRINEVADCEQNARQYADFSLTASSIDDDLWDVFDEAVIDGIVYILGDA